MFAATCYTELVAEMGWEQFPSKGWMPAVPAASSVHAVDVALSSTILPPDNGRKSYRLRVRTDRQLNWARFRGTNTWTAAVSYQRPTSLT